MKSKFMSFISVTVGSVVILLSGCGGNGNSSATSGRATLTFQWPARTRITKLIPVASSSIKINVSVNGQAITSQTVPRPAGTETSTLTFNNLPAGDLTFAAAAYPTVDGTGVAQASASVPVHIVKGGITPFAITMDSTIDHLEVSPNPINITQAQSIDVTVTARDKANQAVMLFGSTISWVSDNPVVARTFSNLQTVKVTGLLTGKVNLTVTETESGTSLKVPVTVATGTVPGYTSQSYPLGGRTSILPRAINDTGDFVATSLTRTLNAHFVSLIVSGGVSTNLNNASSPIDSDSIPYAIRNDKTIVGTSYTFYGTAAQWAPRSIDPTRLAVLGSTNSTSEARGINVSGTIVGMSNGFPAIWTTGSLNAIPPFAGGGTLGIAYAINNSGTIVGSIQNGTGVPTAFYYDTTTHALADMGFGSSAKGINASGDIVGSINVKPSGSVSTFQHAALWHNGVLTDLGALAGDSTSEAVSINSSGQIVGTSTSDGFLYQSGVMYPLTSLGGAHGPIIAGVGINTSGQVLATEQGNYPNPIVLTPH